MSLSVSILLSLLLSVSQRPLLNPLSHLLPLSLSLCLTPCTFPCLLIPSKQSFPKPLSWFNHSFPAHTHSFSLSTICPKTFSYLHAVISRFLSPLPYSFLSTWPWLFPHRCGFPSPPLWQLPINHFYIHRKSAFLPFLSLSLILHVFFLSLITLSLPPLFSHSSFSTSHQISIYAHATKMASPFSQLCHVFIFQNKVAKTALALAATLATAAVNMTYSQVSKEYYERVSSGFHTKNSSVVWKDTSGCSDEGGVCCFRCWGDNEIWLWRAAWTETSDVKTMLGSV